MTRLIEAWRALLREQRLAALAALGLFVTMFLHWYSKTDTVVVHGAAKSTRTSLNAFQAFSFVEVAVLLVSAGVLTVLFSRGEGRGFHLPGGDGAVVTLAGGWASVLIFYRLLDKPGLQGNDRISATVGVEWGIFVALLVAFGLTYAGLRIRHGESPEAPLRRRPRPAGNGPVEGREPAGEAEHLPPRAREPLPEDTGETALIPVAASRAAADRREPATPPRRVRPRFPPPPNDPEQLSFEDPPTSEER